MTQWRVPVGTDEVSAQVDTAGSDSVFVCAHGAGGSMSDRSIVATSRALTTRGLTVIRFNFPYRERKSGRPDRMPTLTATVSAVAGHARAQLNPRLLVIGGRSMGGRAASMLAAEGFEADALLLLAYPLHPPGKPDRLRDAHLSAIRMPVLCFNGTRDPFCTRELMDRAVGALPNWDMHWIEGADHSFHVLKSSGRTDAEVLASIADVSAEWIQRMRE
jgi:uncharacterized protein